jgi:hypothetical protein
MSYLRQIGTRDGPRARLMNTDLNAVGPSFFTPTQAAWQTSIRPQFTGGQTTGTDAGQIAMRTMIRDEQGTTTSSDLATVGDGWMDLPHGMGPNFGTRWIV